MNITSINIKIVDSEPPVRAYVSIIIDDAMAIHKIRVVEKGEQFFVCMPSMKTKAGSYSDVCHPINTTSRTKVVTAILNAFLGQLKSKVV
jgi:stage V sporulation protein G